MPTILSITSETKRGVFSSLFHRKKMMITDYQVQGHTIRLISYSQHRGKIPWKTISSSIAPADQKRLLCPASLRIPQETGLKGFVPSRYRSLMAQNIFFSVLNQADIPPRHLQLMLYDPCAHYQEAAKRMMSYCSQLWIYTENPIDYRKAIQEMREELGGEPLLTVVFAGRKIILWKDWRKFCKNPQNKLLDRATVVVYNTSIVQKYNHEARNLTERF